MKRNALAAVWIVGALALLAGLAACSGSDGTGTPGAGTPVVMQGTMTKGSAILNGVRFDDSQSAVSADDSSETSSYLDDGMTIKLKGTVNDDGVTGTADSIEVENEVRGAIEAGSRGADSFVVLGQTVYVDGGTFFVNTSGLTGASPLADGDKVEVHGLKDRDAAGNIRVRAARVERLGAGAEDEVRGHVTNKDAVSFKIDGGSLTYAYDAGTVIAGGASFANGDLVEVHLDNAGNAIRIELEDAEDSEYQPSDGSDYEVEGYVSGFTVHPGAFNVGDQAVETTAGTVFVGGEAADLVDGKKIEAEGHVSAGVLVAEKVKFDSSMEIEANASGNDSADVMGLDIQVTSLTEFGGGLTDELDIASGDGLKIEGFLNADGVTITATQVEWLSNPPSTVDPDQFVLQGTVSSFSTSGYTLVIAGITVDYALASSVGGDDDSGAAPLTLDQFRAALVAGGTVVKAKGSYAGGTLDADEVEFE